MRGTIFRFIALVAVLLLAPPLAANAQLAERVRRLGYLASAGTGTPSGPNLRAFAEGLREQGYVEGRNLAVEWRWAEGQVGRLRELAVELSRADVDVMLVETTPGTRAAMEATRTIPIVFMFVSDPIGSGFVTSLARPGGNVTGVSNVLPELSGKLLELLREGVPGVSRVAALWNPENPAKRLEFDELQAAAKASGVSIRSLEVRTASDIEATFATMARDRPGAVVVLAEAFTYTHRARIAELALESRLPSVFSLPSHVEAGGMLSYSPSYPAMFHRAGVLVGKILRGTRPADLPVEQPTKFGVVINMKTANALGLKISPLLLLRADQVIE